MATNLDFQIGEKVSWTVGRIISRGCFLEYNLDNTSTIITHFIGGQPANRQIKVLTKLLKLDI